LRSLLETELLEEIARNTSQLSPGFDLATYRHSLQCSYGHLKLYAIDSTDRVEAIKLWNMFIEQTVREALPPTRYELPLDIRQTSEVSKTSEVSTREYFQQPARKVLEAIVPQIPDFSEKSGISTRSVILGDPGAGKSTLLQYLALNWAESQTSEVFKTSEVARLPLLIELREYANSQANGFLDFLHRGKGADWQFDQQQLHQHLQEYPTLVMLDGLDEVFDRATQAAIIDEIIRFAHQYPQAQLLITSRIIGYNPERLQQGNFRHFTIQPLNTDEIHEFIDRWYTLALGNDPDKLSLMARLKEAIAHSKAIQNLADNPLLLTMMAILDRRQELPRDRADLYDQASRVGMIEVK
jgi:predicted NACHT family NTPase